MTSVQPQRASSAAQATLLRVDDLAKSYGGVRAVAGVSFDVLRGRITGLIGPNSAGKSTALGIIAGAIKPSRGSVLLNGTNVAGWPTHKIARRGLARTYQQSSEFSGMTVTENLLTARYGQRPQGRYFPSRASEWRTGDPLERTWHFLLRAGGQSKGALLPHHLPEPLCIRQAPASAAPLTCPSSRRNAMTGLPLCRWREHRAGGTMYGHSDKYIAAPSLVVADFCRACGRRAHGPLPFGGLAPNGASFGAS